MRPGTLKELEAYERFAHETGLVGQELCEAWDEHCALDTTSLQLVSPDPGHVKLQAFLRGLYHGIFDRTRTAKTPTFEQYMGTEFCAYLGIEYVEAMPLPTLRETGLMNRRRVMS